VLAAPPAHAGGWAVTVLDPYRKGWLSREKDGPAWQYRPVASREEYSARLMREALAESRNADVTLVRFLDEITETEADALRRAVRRRSRPQHAGLRPP